MANNKQPAPRAAARNSAAATTDAPKVLYEVVSPLSHDGVAFAVGEGVELTEAQAAPLLGHTVQPIAAD